MLTVSFRFTIACMSTATVLTQLRGPAVFFPPAVFPFRRLGSQCAKFNASAFECRGRAGVGVLFLHLSSLKIFYRTLCLDGSLANVSLFRPGAEEVLGLGTKWSRSLPKLKILSLATLSASFEVWKPAFSSFPKSGSDGVVGFWFFFFLPLLVNVAGAGSSSSVLQEASAWLHTGPCRQPWAFLRCSHRTVRLQKWISINLISLSPGFIWFYLFYFFFKYTHCFCATYFLLVWFDWSDASAPRMAKQSTCGGGV